MPNCKYHPGIKGGDEKCQAQQQRPGPFCRTCPEPGLAEAREKLKNFNTEHTEDTGGGMKEKQNKVKKSKKTEHKVKTPLGDITLTPDTLTPDTRVVKETTIILDKKLLKLAAENTKTLAGIVRVLRDHIEDQALRIADLEAERAHVGAIAGIVRHNLDHIDDQAERIADLERQVGDLENERDAIGAMARKLTGNREPGTRN